MLLEEEWEVLIDGIKRKQCTPFLGAGVCYGILPLGSDIAKEWADRFDYPYPDKTNLISVAQFVALKRDRMTPKHLILDKFKSSAPPDFSDPSEPHRALADLRLPIYLTTNYDTFMTQALRYREQDVEREFYLWNKYLANLLVDSPPIFEREPAYRPTPARPLVFHLHGNEEAPESLVLTEDDYIDFLIEAGPGGYAPPPPIQRALTGSSLLFIGYSIADWNFRVLLGSLNRYKPAGARRLNVAVMPPPSGTEAEQPKVQDYLTRFYAGMGVRVHWSKARDFVTELRSRMKNS